MDLKVSGSMNPKLFEALNKFMEEKKPQNEKEANKFMQEFIELYNNDKLNYEYSPAVKASEILEKVEDAIKTLSHTKELYEKQIVVAKKFRKLKIERQVKRVQNLLDKVTIDFYKVDTSTRRNYR